MVKLYDFLVLNWVRSPENLSALQRLENAMRSNFGGPEIVIRGAHDLDTAFFHGALRENFGVRWGTDVSMRRDLDRPIIGSLYGQSNLATGPRTL
ncbi:hypothetical protein N7G274_001204 [Stereocaulon virgatum]|uniref:Uncharacterized protein n=1 Tax=Stereocaulon virgatum TaxID=373712 RepID=A0ABR4AP15_9LECA